MTLLQRRLSRELGRLKAGTHVQIVLAGAAPSLIYSGSSEGAASAISKLRASDGEADLPAALRLATGLRRAGSEQTVLLRAPEDEKPTVRAPAETFSEHVIGRPFAYQALTGAAARCGLPMYPYCEASASVTNTGGSVQHDQVEVLEGRRPEGSTTLIVQPHSTAAVAFRTPAGRALTLRLEGADSFNPVREGFVAVPPERRVRTTLVGEPAHAEPLARALEADPEIGESLRLRTPATYRPRDAETSELLVMDGWLPPSGVPRTASVLLVAPPYLPAGGAVSGPLLENRLSGSDPASGLLEGVDLQSLTIDAHGARRVTLPSWMQADAWSPEGPLLASGSLDGERLGLLSFEPFRSNLPQLAAFPALISNLVGWSQEFVPTATRAGEPLLIRETPGTSATTVSGAGASSSVEPGPLELPGPGLYTVTQRGTWGTRSQTIAVNPTAGPTQPSPAPVDLYGGASGASGTRTPWWPWVLAGALIVLMLEWFYASRRRVRSALA